MEEKEQNPYEATASPQAEARHGLFSPWFLISIQLVVYLLLVMLLTQPKAKSIFEDFDAELPVITRIALHRGLPAMVGLVIVLFAAKEFLPFSVGAKRSLNLSMIVVVISVGLLFGYAIVRPMAGLIA